jgi:DNA oxidative demethylase
VTVQHALFEAAATPQVLGDGLVLLHGWADVPALRAQIDALLVVSPLRHLTVPSGGRMSVAMSNCGELGWTSDHDGYRYTTIDPLTQRAWPAMPASFSQLAQQAAALAGFASFAPDVCLINCYHVGAALGLHRDSDEASNDHPIVSVSMGATATFHWGGLKRSDRVSKLALHDGDVLVWGGPARLTYHGVAPLRHADPQARRFNLTFRRAG